jgi:hypothetical protein
MRVFASKAQYFVKAFFEAYRELDLRHMLLLQATSSAHCFLSHYGLVQTDRVTTKLQVVSMVRTSKTTKAEMTLNNHLHTGPNLLQCLGDVLFR